MKHITLSALTLLLLVACKKDKKTEPVSNPPQPESYKKIKTERFVQSGESYALVTNRQYIYDPNGRLDRILIADSSQIGSSITVNNHTEQYTYGSSGKISEIQDSKDDYKKLFILDSDQNYSKYIVGNDTLTFTKEGNTTVSTGRSGYVFMKQYDSKNCDSLFYYNANGKITSKQFYTYSTKKDLTYAGISGTFPEAFYSSNEVTGITVFTGSAFENVLHITYDYEYKDGYPVIQIYTEKENNYTAKTFYTYY